MRKPSAATPTKATPWTRSWPSTWARKRAIAREPLVRSENLEFRKQCKRCKCIRGRQCRCRLGNADTDAVDVCVWCNEPVENHVPWDEDSDGAAYDKHDRHRWLYHLRCTRRSRHYIPNDDALAEERKLAEARDRDLQPGNIPEGSNIHFREWVREGRKKVWWGCRRKKSAS